MKNLIYVFFCSMVLLVSCGKEELELIPETVETEVSGDIQGKTQNWTPPVSTNPFKVLTNYNHCHPDEMVLKYQSIISNGYDNPSFVWEVVTPQGVIDGFNKSINVSYALDTEYSVNLTVTYDSGESFSISFCFEMSDDVFLQTCGDGGSSGTSPYYASGGCGGVAAAFYLP